MFTDYPSLDGQYTVFGRVVTGMDVVNAIKKGSQSANGAVASDPDYIARAYIKADGAPE
jgi:peptidylprolyl isomerase